MMVKQKSSVRDMTQGNIWQQVLLFALPLMLGNVFQMLYNTVDSVVVGNYVGTLALAAVGSTTMIVNMFVFFFNGFSTGAGVVIARFFGAREYEKLHRAVETTMAATFVLSAAASVLGVLIVRPALRMMATPEDVFEEASVYLSIYISGIAGLLIYNMGSGVLRAVGDTTRPLYFLILTSVLNIILDLTFVLGLGMGIEGVAYATILSQMVSAVLVLILLTGTREVYVLRWRDLCLDWEILLDIVRVGLPTGLQSVLTAFSNVFVQGYVNAFGSSVMAGWSTYNKLDQFIMLPIQSLSMSATTFVSQNIGAGRWDRVNRGTVSSVLLSLGTTGCLASVIMLLAPNCVGLFTSDPEVIAFGVLFLRNNTAFLMFNCVDHVLAGALRGRGDSRGPMVIMLLGFVAVRQVYLFLVTHLLANTPTLVGLGYPVGWMAVCAMMVGYYFRSVRKQQKQML